MSFQYNDIWLHSYETLIFVGPNIGAIPGDLQSNQYAPDGAGTGYYIQPKDKGQYQFIHIGLDLKDVAGNVYSLAGLTKVYVVPNSHAYYDEFLTAQGAVDLYTPASKYYLTDPSQLPAGDVVRILTTKVLYQAHGIIPNNPQPSRTEMVDTLPPDPPPQPHNEPHSIAFDAQAAAVTSGVSSLTYSHNCGVSATILMLAIGSYDPYNYASVSTATYNGTTMTYGIDEGNAGLKGSFRVMYLNSPSSGSHSVAITWDTTASHLEANSQSYSGVMGGVSSFAGSQGSGTDFTQNVSISGGNWGWASGFCGSVIDYRYNVSQRSDAQYICSGDSNGATPTYMGFEQDSETFWFLVTALLVLVKPSTKRVNRQYRLDKGLASAVGFRKYSMN